MKRITYVSTRNADLSADAIEAIGQVAAKNNLELGVTGFLVSIDQFFFQILEGDPPVVDQLLERIRLDPRHQHLLVLKAEEGVTVRLFPKWSMRTIRLSESNDMILQAIRILLENITQSHRIIERYTQPSVLRFLSAGVNPLEIQVRKIGKIILFGDVVGFSYLCQKFAIEEVTEVVNAYLDACSNRITQMGGEVTKYIGDCIVAYFSPDQADSAIEACLQILLDLRGLRQAAGKCQLMRFLYCGFGLSHGQVIQGNIGSNIKMDYTVLGDTVNIAARLEALTRTIQRAIAFSDEVRQSAKRDWPFECVGEFKLKGQDKFCAVYSLDDPLVGEFKSYDELATDMTLICETNGVQLAG